MPESRPVGRIPNKKAAKLVDLALSTVLEKIEREVGGSDELKRAVVAHLAERLVAKDGTRYTGSLDVQFGFRREEGLVDVVVVDRTKFTLSCVTEDR